VKAKIRETFGADVFSLDSAVDRKALGAKVFGDSTKRKLLESWIHPKTRERIEDFYKDHQDQALAVSIIPLLFESGLEDRYDTVWLLETPEAIQLERLQQHRAMSLADAQARLASQMPLAEKRERTLQHPQHAIIINTGSPDDLYRELDRLLAHSIAKGS
jgi:dephospho-CoA kinase